MEEALDLSSDRLLNNNKNINKYEMGGACSRHGGEERSIQGLGGQTEGRNQLVKHRHRWEYNTGMHLK